MSGLELLGVVAGGAGLLSLSIQLCENAQKLRSLYHQARDAPQTLERLAFEMETMALLLEQLERYRQEDRPSSAFLVRCIESCQRSTARIQEAVNKMSQVIGRHAWTGRGSVAIKGRDIKELLSELEQAKTSLQLAVMTYNAEEQARRFQAQQALLALHGAELDSVKAEVKVGNAMLVRHAVSIDERLDPCQSQRHRKKPLADDDDLPAAPRGHCTAALESRHTHYSRCQPNRRSKNNGAKARSFKVTLPRWLTSRIWDLAMIHAGSGWEISLCMYNLRPKDSKIFEYCWLGNIEGMQRLVANGEASLLDVIDTSCETLLEVSSFSNDSVPFVFSPEVDCSFRRPPQRLSLAAQPDKMAKSRRGPLLSLSLPYPLLSRQIQPSGGVSPLHRTARL